MTGERVPRWRRYLRFLRPDVPADVDDELAFHIDMRVQRNRSLGMSPDDAARDAIERFGDIGAVRAELVTHDQRKHARRARAEYAADFAQDVRFGWRALRRAPAFAIAAVLTLAFGIGANTAIYSVLHAVVLEPLPYAQPERIVALGQGSTGEYLALRSRLHRIADLAFWDPVTHPVDDGRQSARLTGAAVSTNLLPLLGVAPMLGRGFSDADGQFGGPHVLLISHALWAREYASSPTAIGRTVTLDGFPFTIVGVMPPSFRYPNSDVEFWQPYVVDPRNLGLLWGVGGKYFIGRLAPRATVEQAQREVRTVWPSFRRTNPIWDPGPGYRVNATARPLRSALVGSTGALLWMLFASTLLVLAIAGVNVANLLLARATSRERELAVRTALGGGRGRLVRQLVTETLVLAALGAVAGIALAWFGVRALVAAMPATMPRANEVSLDGSALAFAALIAVVTGIACGIITAWWATRAQRSDVALGASARHRTSGVADQRISGALVTGEIALAVILVVAALLLVRSFAALRAIQPGFDATHVVAARISVPEKRFASDTAAVLAYYERLLERTGSIPGVHAAALVDRLPLAAPVYGIAARVQGQFEDVTRGLPTVDHMQIVTPGYFAAMGIPILRGRAFDESDRAGAVPVAIVSQSLARRYWPHGDAIGHRVGYPYASPWITIVGIVPDTKQDSLRDTASTSLYVPWDQAKGRTQGEMWLVTRTTTDAASTSAAIRRVARALDRAVPVSDVQTMDAVVAGSMDHSRFVTILVGSFALLALALGAIGIYGVMSYLVGERTREMGIRIALGASAAMVGRLVVARAAWRAAIGVIIGMGGAFAGTRVLSRWLYGVSPADPVTFIAVPIVFLGVALAASYAPARRATRADPAAALRAE